MQELTFATSCILAWNFFPMNHQIGPLFQIFLIFQLLFGGVTNLFSCTKVVGGYLQKSCKLCHSHWFTYMMRKWLFSGKIMLKLRYFSTFWNFHFLHFSDLSIYFSANFQLLGMELVSNIYLWPILPSPGNNFISTKWDLYLWNGDWFSKKA